MATTKIWAMVRLAMALSLLSSLIGMGMLPVGAQEAGDLAQPATTIKEWVAQIEASRLQITDVRVETTEAGLHVVLETADGSLAVPETRVVGNALIADIPNAAIAEPFEQTEPIEGIALVEVTGLPGDRVRVAITGTNAPPTAEVTTNAQGLALAVTLGDAGDVAEEDAIQVVVIGEQDEGYNPSNASTATRTDTPLRDIPASIQVMPRQVLEDRNVRSVAEAVETVSGVSSPGDGGLLIRGFAQGGGLAGTFRNGYRDVGLSNRTEFGGEFATVERVEVLKGPASVLFGAVEPGGIINLTTRQPLSEPYYNLALEAGNYGFYQPTIDLSGPLTTDDTLLYRFVARYQDADDIQEFVNSNALTIAPSITLNLGDQTSVNFYYEYADFNSNPNTLNDTVILSDGSLSPRSTYLSYPDYASGENTTHRFGYELEHEFSENWQIRNNFAVSISDSREAQVYAAAIESDRFLDIDAYDLDYSTDNYFGQIDLLGRFRTGTISHQLLAGFDFNRNVTNYLGVSDTDLPPLDIFDPDYDISEPEYAPFFQSFSPIESYGVYLQDQINLLDNLKLLIGGRHDWVSTESEIIGDGIDQSVQNDGAFSPRVGLVYQPSDIVSLYASYSRSFRPTSGFNPDGRAFEPTRGTQYEIGVKADFLDGNLSATLAAYHLTRSNVTTPDPDNPLFSIQVGEQRSRGIELDVTGEILPGWNAILSYAYTDAEVTEDNSIPEGTRLGFVPENQASLWTTYTIQEGDLKGLGFGLGLFYVGEREANPFDLSDYLRTDAALYYRRGRFNTAINVRNLFDVDYPVSSFGNAYAQRGAPFTIVGSVSWEF